MGPSNRLKLSAYTIIFILVIIMVISVVMLLGLNVFSPSASAEPTIVKILATPTRAASAGTEQQLSQIDQLMSQTMSASFAYNAPTSMQLNQTAALQLLLNPAISPDALATQIAESGLLVSGTIEVTPRMKAELKAQDEDALVIRPLYNTEQIVSATETTTWEWWVTAKKEGNQHLTLVIYRLVKYEGQDYWREVKTYKADINITVTLAQRIQSLDWKWIAGILIPAILIPAFWRWVDRRRNKRRRAPRR